MPHTQKKHVLLADDDEDDCLLFEDALREVSKHALLDTANDGHELMKMLEADIPVKPDLIFLDLNMPRKNGLECLDEIRKNDNFKNTPVVILSTSAHEKFVRDSYQLGANVFLQKPSSFSALKTSIYKMLHMDWGHGFKQPSFNNFLICP